MAAATGRQRLAWRVSLTLNLRFRSFRTRILVFFLGLLILIQAGIFLAVNTANVDNARRVVDEALVVAASVFQRQLEERRRELLLAARLLSSDFAFKTAYATHERLTIVSALQNHRQRIGADAMLLLTMEGTVLAGTLPVELAPGANPLATLIAQAERSDYGEATDVVFIDREPYQVVVVPLLIPMPDAWVCIGFRIGDEFARGLKQDTLSHVSLLQTDGGQWRTFASTLPVLARGQLPVALTTVAWDPGRSYTLDLAGDDYVSLITALSTDHNPKIIAVLQRPLSAALEPFLRLRWALAALFIVGVLLSVLGATLIARSVTRPVLQLAAGARRIEQGDYHQAVEVAHRDEIGQLAQAFNRMGKGLAERDRVRDLLGKVVSPAIAEELLKREIELGGEEREVTILFSDLRGFTALSENRPPQEVLALLNTYLTHVSAVVETHDGVVDKYIGDAVMALFGAPLRHPDDATRAVATALGMCAALQTLNDRFEQRGWPRLGLGIGINTATVVAGNVGTPTRLNYTVIGDGVNLAARLEALSKLYRVPVIVSASTREAAPGFVYRELDRVRVAGKQSAVTLYQPLGRIGDMQPDLDQELATYAAALADYRACDWDGARTQFLTLREYGTAGVLYELYLERIDVFVRDPPAPDWDGSHAFTQK